MTKPTPTEMYEQTMKRLRPALERVASDPAFRNRLELDPLTALAEMNVELDADTRRELEGKRFSEFWAARRQSVGGPVGLRDLPPKDKDMEAVAGGFSAPIRYAYGADQGSTHFVRAAVRAGGAGRRP